MKMFVAVSGTVSFLNYILFLIWITSGSINLPQSEKTYLSILFFMLFVCCIFSVIIIFYLVKEKNNLVQDVEKYMKIAADLDDELHFSEESCARINLDKNAIKPLMESTGIKTPETLILVALMFLENMKQKDLIVIEQDGSDRIMIKRNWESPDDNNFDLSDEPSKKKEWKM